MARTGRSDPGAKKPAAGQQRLLVGLVAASSIVSVLALVWFKGREEGGRHGRAVDPEHLSGDVQEMTEVAESFVLFWSTFRYEEAAHVATGDSLARVQLAMDKERTLSSAERQLARELRKSVADLEVELVPTEVIDEETEKKILRATATVKASDRTVRREQEFVMVRDRGDWKVSSWDPGEPEGAPDDAVEPGLQLLPDSDADGGAAPAEGAP